MAQSPLDSCEPWYYHEDNWNDFSQLDAEESPLVGVAPTPGILSSAVSITSPADHTQYRTQSQAPSPAVPLLQLDDWDIRYVIKWKVTVNGRAVLENTEKDVKTNPSTYWDSFLPKLDDLLEKKCPNKRLEIDDTKIIASVSGRGSKLTKQFPELHIDWSDVESQLITWTETHAGKELLVNITISYKGTNIQAPANHRGRTNKRGGHSATQRMLAERAAQLHAEESSLGASHWKDVYSLMRCPGQCRLGPHCWRNPDDKKHYKLLTSHLKKMVEYVEQGGEIRTHRDVPDSIRRDILKADEEQRQRQQKDPHRRSASYPPINITNVLPGQSPAINQMEPGYASASSLPTRSSSTDHLNVQGCIDTAVIEYTNWLKSRMRCQEWKDEMDKACKVALKYGLDLQLIYDNQNPQFFVNKGVGIGFAQLFVRDIKTWVEQFQCRTEEP